MLSSFFSHIRRNGIIQWFNLSDTIKNIRILYILTMAGRGASKVDYKTLNAGPFSGVTTAAFRTEKQRKIDEKRNDARREQWKQHL